MINWVCIYNWSNIAVRRIAKQRRLRKARENFMALRNTVPQTSGEKRLNRLLGNRCHVISWQTPFNLRRSLSSDVDFSFSFIRLNTFFTGVECLFPKSRYEATSASGVVDVTLSSEYNSRTPLFISWSRRSKWSGTEVTSKMANATTGLLIPELWSWLKCSELSLESYSIKIYKDRIGLNDWLMINIFRYLAYISGGHSLSSESTGRRK